LPTTGLQPPAQELLGGQQRVGLAREQLELLVVEEQAVHRADRALERVARDVDPQVHGVHGDEARPRALLADAELQVGLDVREEEHVAVP
jgi:hypothetical protein